MAHQGQGNGNEPMPSLSPWFPFPRSQLPRVCNVTYSRAVVGRMQQKKQGRCPAVATWASTAAAAADILRVFAKTNSAKSEMRWGSRSCVTACFPQARTAAQNVCRHVAAPKSLPSLRRCYNFHQLVNPARTEAICCSFYRQPQLKIPAAGDPRGQQIQAQMPRKLSSL